MNDRQIAALRATIDAVWTLTVVGIIAYAGRAQLRAFIARKRSEIETRTAAVNAKTAEARARLGFAHHERERIIAEEFDVIDPRNTGRGGMNPARSTKLYTPDLVVVAMLDERSDTLGARGMTDG